MTEFTLPEWLSIGTISTVGTAILGIIFMFIKMSSTIKATKLNGKAQLGLLDTMTSKLTDMTDVVAMLTTQLAYLKDLRENLLQQLADNKENMKNIAVFVNECFQNSNISAEKKAKLNTAFNNLFYTDKEELITKLSESEAAINKQLEDANKEIAKLTEELEMVKTTTKPKESKKQVI